MISVNSAQDRTILFDLLPLKTPGFRGFDLRLQVLAVPGQAMYAATRRLVLKGADSLVFVANSALDRWEENLQSYREMTQNLLSHHLDPGQMPLVFQYNKRDLPQVLEVEALDRALNTRKTDVVPAVAMRGEGVLETFIADPRPHGPGPRQPLRDPRRQGGHAGPGVGRADRERAVRGHRAVLRPGAADAKAAARAASSDRPDSGPARAAGPSPRAPALVAGDRGCQFAVRRPRTLHRGACRSAASSRGCRAHPGDDARRACRRARRDLRRGLGAARGRAHRAARGARPRAPAARRPAQDHGGGRAGAAAAHPLETALEPVLARMARIVGRRARGVLGPPARAAAARGRPPRALARPGARVAAPPCATCSRRAARGAKPTFVFAPRTSTSARRSTGRGARFAGAPRGALPHPRRAPGAGRLLLRPGHRASRAPRPSSTLPRSRARSRSPSSSSPPSRP